MCSLQNDEYDEIKIEENEIFKIPVNEKGMCKKCEKSAVIYMRNVGSYCSECLLAFVTHKFRGCLGKSKIVRKNEQVILAFSGGQASTLMLYLVKSMLNLTTCKRKDIKPTIVYIDESGLFEDCLEETETNLKKIIDLAEQFEFPTYITSLASNVFQDDWENSESLIEVKSISDYSKIIDDSLKIRLKELFQSISQLTSKEDLLLKLRNELLAKVALKLKCTKIFVGDSQELLSFRLLTDIALGKGRILSQTTGLSDDRFEGVTLVRPLRELSKKEISFCINNLRLETICQPSFSTKQKSKASVQTLTEKFILDLQDNFPATVSTIFRTGEKLKSNNSEQHISKENCCIICSEELSIKFCESRTLPTPRCANNCECSSDIGNKNETSLQLDELNSFCCYSCRLIVKDLTNIDLLPLCIREKYDKRVRRRQMKSQISEFLLDPENS